MKDEQESREKEVSLTMAASNSVILSKHEEKGKIQKLERHDQGQINNQNELEVNNRKLDIVTAGLQRYVYKQLLEQISQANSITIADYILAQKTEVNLADSYRANILTTLISLSKLLGNKPFKTMTRDDILYYLDTIRKPEVSDPQHKWIGSYNEKRQRLVKFFKWLDSPNAEPNKRQKPKILDNIPTLKRKEQSIYKPTDMWTREEDLLFLLYCPNKRDKCYHAISRDSSARPHELLGVKIKDIVFKITHDNKQYAEVIISGKTGSRAIPLIDSIPYLKDWIDSHPQHGNRNALLIPSLNHATLGRKMTYRGINHAYRHYKTALFPKLLEDPNVCNEDKQKIRELLKKPWNPYIRRHSALTEKSTMLKDHILKQHAGWSQRSNMHLKYLHYYGNESNESILEAYGIVTKNRQSLDALKPKQCPNCNEGNKPDSKFCAKCRMVLTYDAYNETLEKQQERESEVKVLQHKYEQDMNAMKEQMSQIMSMIQYNPSLAQVKPEVLSTKRVG